MGGVTSGIVGRSLPRLGLFGSSVERARRLHQTSLPGMIQCSKEFCDLVRHRSVKLMPGQVVESTSKGSETGYIVTSLESKSGIALMKENVEGALRELAQFLELRGGNEGSATVMSSSDYDTSGAVIRRLDSDDNGTSLGYLGDRGDSPGGGEGGFCQGEGRGGGLTASHESGKGVTMPKRGALAGGGEEGGVLVE